MEEELVKKGVDDAMEDDGYAAIAIAQAAAAAARWQDVATILADMKPYRGYRDSHEYPGYHDSRDYPLAAADAVRDAWLIDRPQA